MQKSPPPLRLCLEDTGWAVYVGRVQKGTHIYLFQQKYFEPGIVMTIPGIVMTIPRVSS